MIIKSEQIDKIREQIVISKNICVEYTSRLFVIIPSSKDHEDVRLYIVQ